MESHATRPPNCRQAMRQRYFLEEKTLKPDAKDFIDLPPRSEIHSKTTTTHTFALKWNSVERL